MAPSRRVKARTGRCRPIPSTRGTSGAEWDEPPASRARWPGRARRPARAWDELGHRLPTSGPAGAERADGELAPPRERAREQQVGQVGAADEEHCPDRGEQHEQRPAHGRHRVVQQGLDPHPDLVRVGVCSSPPRDDAIRRAPDPA